MACLIGDGYLFLLQLLLGIREGKHFFLKTLLCGDGVFFWVLNMCRAFKHVRMRSAKALDSGESECLCNLNTNSMEVAAVFEGGGIQK